MHGLQRTDNAKKTEKEKISRKGVDNGLYFTYIGKCAVERHESSTSGQNLDKAIV